MAPNTLDSDITLNKTNLLFAQNQRLVASWLPLKRKHGELRNMKTEAETENEVEELFDTPALELSGVGLKTPKDGEVRREELSSNDKLLKQLLGKDYMKKRGNGAKVTAKVGSSSTLAGSKPRPLPARRTVEDGSEDEGGRSSLGKSRHDGLRKHDRRKGDSVDDAVAEPAEAPASLLEEKSQRQKKASNYLDEVLADRSRKKRKSSKKKKSPNPTIGAVKHKF